MTVTTAVYGAISVISPCNLGFDHARFIFAALIEALPRQSVERREKLKRLMRGPRQNRL
jgi:hypothetical protein